MFQQPPNAIQANTINISFDEDYRWDDKSKVMIITRKQVLHVKALGVVEMNRQLSQAISTGKDQEQIKNKMRTCIRKAKQEVENGIEKMQEELEARKKKAAEDAKATEEAPVGTAVDEKPKEEVPEAAPELAPEPEPSADTKKEEVKKDE